jgi:hypothetical protein
MSVWSEEIHHRDTESTEGAQRNDLILCVTSVSSVSLW